MAENGDAAGDWTLSQVDRASVMVVMLSFEVRSQTEQNQRFFSCR